MKAKEYADRYLKSENKDNELCEIMRAFFNEIKEIQEKRNARSNDAMITILNEQHQKWQKFAGIINARLPVTRPILYMGFKNTIHHAIPELRELWK